MRLIVYKSLYLKADDGNSFGRPQALIFNQPSHGPEIGKNNLHENAY